MGANEVWVTRRTWGVVMVPMGTWWSQKAGAISTCTYMIPYGINASKIIQYLTHVHVLGQTAVFTMYMYMYVKVVSKSVNRTGHMITVIMQSSKKNTHKLTHHLSPCSKRKISENYTVDLYCAWNFMNMVLQGWT